MSKHKDKTERKTFNGASAVRTEDLLIERSAWMRNKLRNIVAHNIALRKVSAESSDPFTYARTKSHLLNNVTTPECY